MTQTPCRIASDALELEVSSLGAEMQYLRSSSGKELLWHGDPAFWSGRAPVLFPIVGRAVDDTVSAGGVSAEMKQHGFARRQEFELVEQTEAMCRHVLHASEATRETYPFEFSLSVTHAVARATLTVTAEVTNEGDTEMPFGFGFHPAFCLPLAGGDGAHHVTLASGGSPQRQPLRPDGLLENTLVEGPFVNGQVEITDALFEEGALVFPGGTEPVRYGSQDGPSLAFTFENLPDLALWRPVGAPFLCVEPWHGTASCVGDGPEIAQRPNAILLAPGDSKCFAYHVTFVE